MDIFAIHHVTLQSKIIIYYFTKIDMAIIDH